jgi:ankyrin repeat protein
MEDGFVSHGRSEVAELMAEEYNLALIWAAGSNQVSTLRAVVEHGADIHRPGDRGHLAVCVAAYEGALDALKYLVEIGGDASRSDCRGTPLRQARRMRRAAVMEYLESLGARE